MRCRTHLSSHRQQFWDTDQIVADQIEQKIGGDSRKPPVFRLTHGAMLFAPSKQTFDHYAFALREGVSLVPGGSSVDGCLAYGSGLHDIRVDGDMRRDVRRPQARHVCCNVIGLVGTNRDTGMW